MPFVRIDAFGTDADRLDALGRAVHDALVETLGIPANDRFQVLTGHDGARTTLRWDDYLGVHRDEGIVFVAITLRSGRPSRAEAGAVPADRRVGRGVRRHRAPQRLRHPDGERLPRLVAGSRNRPVRGVIAPRGTTA
ncbi:tautomerase family protein [Streptomyces sp. UP1A-1]|nr:tautomerase family protein [Streptomyces sp. UP1A-1]